MRFACNATVPELLLLTFVVGCSTGVRLPIAAGTVALVNQGGAPVGTAQLRQEAGGLVHVDINVVSLPPGSHGIHFHEVGRCEGASSFETAGAHFNPLGREHGLSRPGGPHAGDAPNLVVSNDGTATFSFTSDRVTLTAGATSLLDSNGSSLVVHAAADDQVSQPSGNSGARIACGVVQSIP
jgi:Cu-Zn family superoxide dismutase